MKAAKVPPTLDVIAEALVAVDLLQPGVRPVKSDEEQAILGRVSYAAIAEYLRQFPRSRNKGRSWVAMPVDGEWDYQCLFCRKSLNTLPQGSGVLPQPFVDSLNAHAELCGAMFLAGMLEAVGADGKRATAFNKRRKRRS